MNAEPAKPRIRTGSDPATIRALIKAIDGNRIPDLYVTAGQVVHVEQVSGSAAATAGDEDSPLPVTATQVGAAELAALLAEHTYTYKETLDHDRKIQQEVTPRQQLLNAALAPKTRPGINPMHGIAGAPVLRPDGTLLQETGYDPATGLYLASKIPLPKVPPSPTAAQVEEARSFLLDEFLHDFPWAADADRANYLGVLATPILRRYLRTLIPFVVYTATMPSSGKTILTSGPGMLYGQRVLTWTSDDAELRKSITSVMADPVGTVIFDNLAEGTVIDSPVLARLITDRTWADRLLGGNVTATYANDRLWCATGNNLQLGGDMATRTVLIRLDPNMPRPEERTAFIIQNLDQWILQPGNQRKVLWNLLVLIIDWINAGASRETGLAMRQFTPWAEAVGGFLSHHSVKGFLANIENVRNIDEETERWIAFLAHWRQIFGGEMVTAQQVRESADVPPGICDPWEGLFVSPRNGKPLNAVSLGKLLSGQIGRYRGSYVLRSPAQLNRVGLRLWHVEERSE